MSRGARGLLEAEGRPFSWVREGVVRGRPLVLLAHGAGAPMDSPFLEAVAAGLAARGMAVARFQFPYMERMQREGRRRPPDARAVLLATWRAMLDQAGRWRGARCTVVAGKSLGARMASLLLAEEAPDGVAAGVWLGYPLHPAGRPERLRDAHLPAIRVPQLFVSGTRDPLCDLELLAPVLARIGRRARLLRVAGGDHSLAVSRKDPLRGSAEWLDRVAEFVAGLSGRAARG